MAAHLPSYSSSLDAYHAAFATELKAMIAALPFLAGDRIVDIGCGDGTYTGWIADQVAPSGSVTAVDVSAAYLRRARSKLKTHRYAKRIKFVVGNIKRLPFKDGTFDGVWCAQSFFSFPEPAQALRELRRIVRPGGVIVVLENDTFHHVLLPWPVDVELAICAAQYRAYQGQTREPEKAYVGRDLRKLFIEAGLKPQRKKLHVSQRESPLSAAEERYLRLHLKTIRDSIKGFLRSDIQSRVDAFLDPKSKTYLLKQRELTLTCLDHLVWGKKP